MTAQQQAKEFEQEPIGQILVRRGAITAAQLAEALQAQKREPGFLGETLVRLGYLQEIDVVVALIVQCGLPYIAINKYELDKKILELIPGDIAREFLVIPLDRVGRVLSVVMADPLNEQMKRKLQEITGCRIAPFIATKSQIMEAVRRWYP